MIEPTGVLHWDLQEISRSLKINPEDVREYFTDGRRVSFILERRLAYEIMKGSIAPSEGAGFDVLDSKGQKWEVRSVTHGGVYFCPSYMVGSGRSFCEKGFLEKLDDIAGYILSDVESFPDVPFWIIPRKQVEVWYETGKLGAGTKISRDKALRYLEDIPNK